MDSRDVKIEVELKKNENGPGGGIIKFVGLADEFFLRVIVLVMSLAGTGGGRAVIKPGHIAGITPGGGAGEAEIDGVVSALEFWAKKKVLTFTVKKQPPAALEIIPLDDDISAAVKNGKAEDGESPPKVETKIYSIDDLSQTIECDSEFRRLIHESQLRFKAVFNPHELSVLFSLYSRGLESDLIIEITEVLAAEGKCNVRYLERVALGFASNEIKTAEEYRRYYEDVRRAKDSEEKVTALFEMGDKKPTSAERELIKQWTCDFNFTDDILLYGAELCRRNIKKISLPYIHKILLNWHEKGYTGLNQIKSEHSPSGAAPPQAASSFNITKFFETAVNLTANMMNGEEYAVQ